MQCLGVPLYSVWGVTYSGVMRRVLVLVAGMAAALALPAVAFAENMSSAPGDGTTAQDAVLSGEVSSSGSLPFTGLNLALIVVAGLALVATGLLLRRRSQDSHKA